MTRRYTIDQIARMDNEAIKEQFDEAALRSIRAMHVFRKVARIAFETMIANKWLMGFYALGFVGSTTTGILLWHLLNPKKTSREYRKELMAATIGPIAYRPYLDFAKVGAQGRVEFDTGQMFLHFGAQGKALMIDTLDHHIGQMNDCLFKRVVLPQLVKRRSKGQLVVVPH